MMKLIPVAVLALAATPAPAVAQETPAAARPQATPPAAPPAAAARLPNVFDDPAARAAAASAPQAPPPVQAEQIGPDVKRAEDALRAFVAAAQGPGLDYEVFSPDLAERIRSQEARLLPALKGFGELQDVIYVGQDQGAELFALDFANARTQWIIAFNGEDQIAVLLFRPAQAQ